MKSPLYKKRNLAAGCDYWCADYPYSGMKHTVFLCSVFEGIEKAKSLARKLLINHVLEALDL